MIICSCNALSDHDVRGCALRDDAPRKVSEVYACLGCSPQCGACARTIRQILRDASAGCAGCPNGCDGKSDLSIMMDVERDAEGRAIVIA